MRYQMWDTPFSISCRLRFFLSAGILPFLAFLLAFGFLLFSNVAPPIFLRYPCKFRTPWQSVFSLSLLDIPPQLALLPLWDIGEPGRSYTLPGRKTCLSRYRQFRSIFRISLPYFFAVSLTDKLFSTLSFATCRLNSSVYFPVLPIYFTTLYVPALAPVSLSKTRFPVFSTNPRSSNPFNRGATDCRSLL